MRLIIAEDKAMVTQTSWRRKRSVPQTILRMGWWTELVNGSPLARISIGLAGEDLILKSSSSMKALPKIPLLYQLLELLSSWPAPIQSN